MTDTTLRRPPFDPELEAALALVGDQLPSTLTPEMIALMRQSPVSGEEEIFAVLAERGFTRRDVTIAGHGGDEIVVSVVEKEGRTGTGPGFFHTHGGGMIIGNRWLGVAGFLEWAERFNGVIVTVEYRLAPEFPDPYPVEDCYAALLWTAENAEELGIDLSRLLIGGGSAGGGLAAGTALLARDRKGPELIGQLLIYPMLDDRNETASSHQVDGFGVWDRGSNDTGWDALLGDRRKTDAVSIYAKELTVPDLTEGPRGPVVLSMSLRQATGAGIERLRDILGQHPGVTEVHVRLNQPGRTVLMRLDDAYRVTPSPALYGDLKALLGQGCLV